MATQQFVKWWKTKFQAGGCSYKTMSVVGSDVSDGKPSDTEDLMKDDGSTYNNGAHVNLGLASSTASENIQRNQAEESQEVNFEDFECDVHVEESESGEEKKEFSFTFYDLDGYGKITKDDVAGLVRSIYGAVNDSIKVPQGGKKTIKVRLTVTPEKSNANDISEHIQNNNLNSNGMGNSFTTTIGEAKSKLRNNVNVTIQENLHKERSSKKDKEGKDRLFSSKPKFHSVRIPSAHCRGCRNYSPEMFRDCSASPLRHRKKWRDRHCVFQKPELIDLVQANMEKNNVSPCCRRDQFTHHQQHSLSHCANQNQLNDPHSPMSLFRNENYWKQKLADLTQNQGWNRFQGGKSHDCNNHKQLHGAHLCKKHGHHRSRSHDLSPNILRCPYHADRDKLTSQTPTHPPFCTNNHVNIANIQECLEMTQGCGHNQHQLTSRNKNTNVTNSASPHQFKHRNREQEHARAMAQVINWLERENIGERFSSPSRKISNPNSHEHIDPGTEENSSPKGQDQHVNHVHIHHHYHHYAKETPIIV